MPEVVLAILSGIGSTVASVVTFSRVLFDIKNTRTDVKTCLDLVQRVDHDIQYAISLRTKNLKLLAENPHELKRIDGIIGAATDSILDVGRLLESCRPEAHGGRVPFRGKVKWVLGDSTAFMRRTGNLQQQHAAINIEITYMRGLEPPRATQDPSANTFFENTDLFWVNREQRSPQISSPEETELPPPPSYSRPMYRQASMPEFLRVYEGAVGTGNDTVNVSRDASSSNAQGTSHLTGELAQDRLLERESEDEDSEMAFFRTIRMREEERASTSNMR